MSDLSYRTLPIAPISKTAGSRGGYITLNFDSSNAKMVKLKTAHVATLIPNVGKNARGFCCDRLLPQSNGRDF